MAIQLYTLSEQITEMTAKFQTEAKVRGISRDTCQEHVFLVLVSPRRGLPLWLDKGTTIHCEGDKQKTLHNSREAG